MQFNFHAADEAITDFLLYGKKQNIDMSHNQNTNKLPTPGAAMREVVFKSVASTCLSVDTATNDTYRYLIATNDDGQMFIHSLDGAPLAGPFDEIFAR